MIRSALVVLVVALVYYDPAMPARGDEPDRAPRSYRAPRSWQLEWDDTENYAAHPAVLGAAAAGLGHGRLAEDAPTLSASLLRPVLGVWEPVAVCVKAATAYAVGATVHHARGEGPLLPSAATTPALDTQQLINDELPAAVFATSAALLVVSALLLLGFTDALVAEIANTIFGRGSLPRVNGRKAKRGGERRHRRGTMADAVTRSLKTGSLAATLIWAVHPLRVEVVGWLSCQPYLLATTFSLICIKARLARFRLWRSALSRRHRHRRKYPQGRSPRATDDAREDDGSQGWIWPTARTTKSSKAARVGDQLRQLLLRLTAFVSFGLAVASKVRA